MGLLQAQTRIWKEEEKDGEKPSWQLCQRPTAQSPHLLPSALEKIVPLSSGEAESTRVLGGSPCGGP